MYIELDKTLIKKKNVIVKKVYYRLAIVIVRESWDIWIKR